MDHPPLFDPPLLRLLASEHAPSDVKCGYGLRELEKLTARHADGSLAILSETRVEQSFNERLFAEIFDYDTLFRSSGARYHLRPKGRNPANGRFDDFSLGFFDADGGSPLAIAELKSPGQDLDRQQSGRSYDGISPVEQVHRAADGMPVVHWVLISNFDEIRLYRAGARDRFESAVLSEVLSVADFRRVYALFSRATLLGDGRRDSPLDRLYKKGCPMIVPPKPGFCRLVQTAVLELVLTDPLSLPEMHDRISAALKELPGWCRHQWLRTHPSDAIELEEDRLVVRFGHPEDRLRIEFTNAGIIHVSQYLGDEGGFRVAASDILLRTVSFLVLVATSAAKMVTGSFRVSADLLDIAGTVLYDETMGQVVSEPFRAPDGKESMHAPPRSRLLAATAESLTTGALGIIRELLFGFVSVGYPETRARFLPKGERTREIVDALLASQNGVPIT